MTKCPDSSTDLAHAESFVLETPAVKRAMKGDKEAFAACVSVLEDKLYGLAYSIVGNRHDAEDVWQTAIFKAWREIRRLRTPEAFKTWLTRIVLNEARSSLRRTRRERPDDLVTGAVFQDNGERGNREAFSDDGAAVRQYIRRLPIEQREALVLRFWMGFPLKTVAEIARIPLGTAKTRVYAGVQALKRMMEDDGYEPGD